MTSDCCCVRITSTPCTRSTRCTLPYLIYDRSLYKKTQPEIQFPAHCCTVLPFPLPVQAGAGESNEAIVVSNHFFQRYRVGFISGILQPGRFCSEPKVFKVYSHTGATGSLLTREKWNTARECSNMRLSPIGRKDGACKSKGKIEDT